jgi:hypothetical protein
MIENGAGFCAIFIAHVQWWLFVTLPAAFLLASLGIQSQIQ